MYPPSNTPAFIICYDEDVVEGVESCTKSLVGKIQTTKLIHMNSIQNALAGIWCNPPGFRVEEIAPKTFQFFFEKVDDADRILKGSPWLFRNSWLVLKKWQRDLKIDQVDFQRVLMKVQLWGLPLHCRTSKMGLKIGSCLGNVLEFDVFDERDRGTFVKILVEVDISKPLLPGIPVGSHKDGVTWVEFKYEQLPQFCFRCGYIGHIEDLCKKPIILPHEDNEERREFGPWMQASHIGRKVRVSQHCSDGQPWGDQYQRTKGPLPCDVTELLDALSVNNSPQTPKGEDASLIPSVSTHQSARGSSLNDNHVAINSVDKAQDDDPQPNGVEASIITLADKENHVPHVPCTEPLSCITNLAPT
ncbi:Zinc finger, CCHC-type [Sesbania bispinosa]|nr:Zinc finger, CCHC-type [Sesbania bispinosa]